MLRHALLVAALAPLPLGIGCVVDATTRDGDTSTERPRDPAALPLWYTDLSRWKRDHPGAYAIGTSPRVLDEQSGWSAAQQDATSKAGGRVLDLEAFFFLDDDGRPIATFDSSFGFKKVVALYRLEDATPAPPPAPAPDAR